MVRLGVVGGEVGGGGGQEIGTSRGEGGGAMGRHLRR